MSFARAFFLVTLATCIALAAVLAVGCDSSGTLVGVDSGTADAGADVVVVNFDGPSLFDSSPAEASAGDASDATTTTDAAAFAFIEFSEVPVGGGTFTAAFSTTPLQPPPGCVTEAPDGGA